MHASEVIGHYQDDIAKLRKRVKELEDENAKLRGTYVEPRSPSHPFTAPKLFETLGELFDAVEKCETEEMLEDLTDILHDTFSMKATELCNHGGSAVIGGLCLFLGPSNLLAMINERWRSSNYKEAQQLSRSEKVLQFLKGKDWTSPTDIGKSLWGPKHHSSSASPVCLRMVEKGLLERNDRGHYRIRK